MLEVFFCNVGDGDAALLIEHRDGEPDFTVLVDAGRPYLEPKQGSLRKEAIYYCKAKGVKKIDLMLLTHLHIDHIGGAMRILNAIPTRRLIALTLPPEDAEWVTPSFTSVDKATNGLCQLLNIFNDLVRCARQTGCRVEAAEAGPVPLTDRLTMTTYLPKADVIARQRAMFFAMYRNEPVDFDECYRVSKERNVSSLMHRFAYAGRSVLLTGDRYAADWADEGLAPCDILKLPHHGDQKSMTPGLLLSLRPTYAVISCQNDPKPKKERPSAGTVELLDLFVPNVLCTETRTVASLGPCTHNGVRFTIEEDGTIACETE